MRGACSLSRKPGRSTGAITLQVMSLNATLCSCMAINLGRAFTTVRYAVAYKCFDGIYDVSGVCQTSGRSSLARCLTAVLQASSRSHDSCTPVASGDTMPSPVTTTRRRGTSGGGPRGSSAPWARTEPRQRRAKLDVCPSATCLKNVRLQAC